MRVTDVCIVSRLTPVDIGRVGVTAMDKRPVDGPIKLSRIGLWGDLQADRANHGGTEKALYAMSNQEMAWWEQELGDNLPAGIFGENLRVDGDVDTMIIGARYRLGTALLEVSGPRTPCRTFEFWRDEKGWMKRFTARGRTGVYFRVIDPGTIEAGNEFEEISVPSHGVSTGDWFRTRPEPSAALVEAHKAGDINLASYVIKYLSKDLRETL